MSKKTISCNYLILVVVLLFALILVFSKSALAHHKVVGGECGICGVWYEGTHNCRIDEYGDDEEELEKEKKKERLKIEKKVNESAKKRDRAWQKANKYFNKRRWDKAIRYYNKALKYDPENQDILLSKQRAEANKNQELARKREKKQMTKRDKIWKKGNKYFNQEKWDRAIKYYLEALKYDSGNPDILHNLRLARENKYYEKRKNRLERRDKALIKGKEYFSKKEWDYAIKYYQEALENAYKDKEVFRLFIRQAKYNKAYYKALEYYNNKDLDNAKVYLEKALSISPRDPEALYYLGMIRGKEYCNNEDWDNAIKHFNKALKLSPNDAKALHYLKLSMGKQDYLKALEYFHNEEWYFAITYFKEALKLSPDDKEAMRYLELAEERKASEKKISKEQDEFEKETAQMLDETLSDPRKHTYSATLEVMMEDPGWASKQRDQILKAVEEDRKWVNEILDAIKVHRYPDPKYRPKTLNDLRPGDILLMEPKGIGNILAVADQLVTGRAFTEGKIKAPVSHATMFIRNPDSGENQFFDHTSARGSHLLKTEEFIKKYSHRKMFVARPIKDIDGKKIWEEVEKEISKTKEGKVFGTKFGFFGKDKICSEEMIFVIAKVTGFPFKEKYDRLIVATTPSDLFDKNSIGKFFIITHLESRDFPTKKVFP